MYQAELVGLTNFACRIGGVERDGIIIGGELKVFTRGEIYTVTDEVAKVLRKQTDMNGVPYFRLTKIASDAPEVETQEPIIPPTMDTADEQDDEEIPLQEEKRPVGGKKKLILSKYNKT